MDRVHEFLDDGITPPGSPRAGQKRGRPRMTAAQKTEAKRLRMAAADVPAVARRGRPPKNPEDKAKPYGYNFQLQAAHPSSPHNFAVHLNSVGKTGQPASVMRNLLKHTDWAEDIHGFIMDPLNAEFHIMQNGSKSNSANTRQNILKTIINHVLDRNHPWAVMDDIPNDVRNRWQEIANRIGKDAVDNQNQAAAGYLTISLDKVWDVINAAYPRTADPSKRSRKAETLLRFCCFYWPVRDNLHACTFVRREEDCTDPKMNYIIGDLEDPSKPWKFYLQYGKTTGVKRKYAPMMRNIPMSLTDEDNLTGDLTVNECLREYIATWNRNSAKQPPRAFPYGSQPFGTSSLSKFLRDSAVDIGLMDKDTQNGFVNHMRKWWEGWARDMDRIHGSQIYHSKVTAFMMHSPQIADLAYKREDHVTCACAGNPMNPINRRKRDEHLKQRSAHRAALHDTTSRRRQRAKDGEEEEEEDEDE